MARIAVVVLGVVFAFAAGAQSPGLVEILAGELDRNFRILSAKGEPPAYFASYRVTEVESAELAAESGALLSRTSSRARFLDVSIRVGSAELDNYRRLPGQPTRFAGAVRISVDDLPSALLKPVWLETDRVYRQAAERLIRIKTNNQVTIAGADASNDFSGEDKVVDIRPAGRLRAPSDKLTALLRRLSAVASGRPAVITARVSLDLRRETKYLVNSEGSRLRHGRGFARISFQASGKAPDGMDLFAGRTFDAEDVDGLPEERILSESAAQVADQIGALVRAPLVEPFVGAAILSGRAAAVFFHEIFGHRIEGHRLKDETDGQTFARKVGERVLPDFLSVVFDPTRKSAAGISLNGFYGYDDEGVKARPVQAVEGGVLKSFLMSRSPLAGFARSNGHGRAQAGADPVSRQSNLIVESAKAVPEVRLREMLVEELKRQSKPYGLYFEEVTGGFTTTARRGVQAFKVIPLVVYRVFADGRPDELVRGADIVGTPLASFARIVATGDKPGVFNGYCGAESGSVPVSAVAPAVLVSEIEVQRKEASRDRPPLLSAPVSGGSE